MPPPPAEFGFGDFVHDCDDDEPSEAVIVNTPPVTAAEWDAYEKWDGSTVTVAEDNPDYPADAEVVVVVFRDDLDEAFPEWPDREESFPLEELNDAGVPHYAFPAPRLTPVEPDGTESERAAADEDESDGASVVPGPLVDLKARLADANWIIDVTDDGLTVEKLGERYTIHPDGTVESDGNIREPLEHTVAKYFG